MLQGDYLKLAGLAVWLVITKSADVQAEHQPIASQRIKELVQQRILGEEKVKAFPPDELLRDAQTDSRLLVGSLAGEDLFFKAYAKKLQAVTDKQFPQARQVRAMLIEVFNLTDDFIVGIFDGGSNHHPQRNPGYIEWDLFHGYSNAFTRPLDTRYSIDDIRAVGALIIRANWQERATELAKGPRDEASALNAFLPPLEHALSRLREVEMRLPPNARYYFRQRLVRDLSRFL